MWNWQDWLQTQGVIIDLKPWDPACPDCIPENEPWFNPRLDIPELEIKLPVP